MFNRRSTLRTTISRSSSRYTPRANSRQTGSSVLGLHTLYSAVWNLAVDYLFAKIVAKLYRILFRWTRTPGGKFPAVCFLLRVAKNVDVHLPLLPFPSVSKLVGCWVDLEFLVNKAGGRLVAHRVHHLIRLPAPTSCPATLCRARASCPRTSPNH